MWEFADPVLIHRQGHKPRFYTQLWLLFYRSIGENTVGRNVPVVICSLGQPNLHGVIGGELDEVVRNSPRSCWCRSQATEKCLHLHSGSGKWCHQDENMSLSCKIDVKIGLNVENECQTGAFMLKIDWNDILNVAYYQ